METNNFNKSINMFKNKIDKLTDAYEKKISLAIKSQGTSLSKKNVMDAIIFKLKKQEEIHIQKLKKKLLIAQRKYELSKA